MLYGGCRHSLASPGRPKPRPPLTLYRHTGSDLIPRGGPGEERWGRHPRPAGHRCLQHHTLLLFHLPGLLQGSLSLSLLPLLTSCRLHVGTTPSTSLASSRRASFSKTRSSLVVFTQKTCSISVSGAVLSSTSFHHLGFNFPPVSNFSVVSFILYYPGVSYPASFFYFCILTLFQNLYTIAKCERSQSHFKPQSNKCTIKKHCSSVKDLAYLHTLQLKISPRGYMY